MRTIAGFVIACAFLTGCATSQPTSGMVRTKYIKTADAHFILQKRSQQLVYSLTFDVRKTLRENVLAQIEFENPAPNGKPFIVAKTLEPRQTRFTVQSPPFSGITNPRDYKVVLRLYRGNELLSTHTQYVTFSMPSEELTAAQIEIYPAPSEPPSAPLATPKEAQRRHNGE